MNLKSLKTNKLLLPLLVAFWATFALNIHVHAANLITQRAIKPAPITDKLSTAETEYEPGTVLVKFKAPLQSSNSKKIRLGSFLYSNTDNIIIPKSMQAADKMYGLTSINKALPNSKNKEFNKFYIVKFKSQNSKAIASALRKYPEVQYVNLNYKLEFFADEDPRFNEQWHLHNPETDIDIDSLEAFGLSAYGVFPKNKDTIVSIIDHPLYANHPDLKDSVWVNKNEIANDGLDNDNNGYIDDSLGCFFGHVESTYDCDVYGGAPTILDHGTQVAGVVGATHNNGEGVKGICPNCKVMRAGVPYFYYNVLEALSYSVDHGAKVINMSWGFTGNAENFEALQEMLNYAHASGVTLVAANGNSNGTFMFAPARLNNVIAVAALDNENKKATFSTYGDLTDISAPGVSILTTHHSSRYTPQLNTYVSESGTSFAAPIVSGTAGMLLSYSPELNPDQIEKIMKETSDPIIYTSDYQIGKMGAGRVNTFRALYKSLNLKNVFKDITIANVQCYENKTRLEIRDKKGIKVDGKSAKHIIDNVYSHWVENGKPITVVGTGWTTKLTIPSTCKLTPIPVDF